MTTTPDLQRGPRIEGQWIVTFKGGTPSAHVKTALHEALKRGGSARFTYANAVLGFTAALGSSALDHVRQDPRVLAVEPDYRVYATGIQPSPPSWGLDRLDQGALPLSKSYSYGPTGTGVTAYVLDTGVRTTHADFGGRAVAGFSAINDGRGTQDCNGHGTHVAGTIGGTQHGVAKGVRIVAVRVLDCDGTGSTSGVIAGVDWVTAQNQGPSVANLSLSGGASTALDQAITRSIASGVNYAVAAGNDNRDACGDSPARLPAAITVGASTRADSRAGFSNYGPCVDLFAPGDAITSTFNSSDTETAVYSGTSMATPHVAGVIATYLQANPTAAPADVHAALIQGSRLNELGEVGAGSANRLLSSTNPAPSQSAVAPPVASVPSAEIYGTSRVRNFAAPVRLSWTSSAPGSGIHSHEIQRSPDGGATWTNVALAAPTATSTIIDLARGSWTFRVRAINAQGVTGAWSTGPRLHLRVERQNAATLRPAKQWKKVEQTNALGGTITRTNVRGAAATFRFTGTSVSWVGTLAPNRGKAQVFLDGRSLGVVDLYAPNTRARQVILTRKVSAGTHLLRIVALGQHGRSARGSYIDLDAFITLG